MIYIDNAATSFPKPEAVYRALETFARAEMANPWKGEYAIAARSQRVMEGTRDVLNRFFAGEGASRWVHTFNGTDGLNIAIKGSLKRGDHVVTTDLEHDSVSRPLHALEAAGMIRVTRVASDRGYVDPDAIRKASRRKTAMVALTHASNVLGTVQPVEEIGPIVREAGALLLLDVAQSAGMVPLDLRRAEVDLLAISGHKMLFGPTGTGALYVGPRADPRPWREGDTGGESKGDVHPSELPYRLEGGTPNVLGIAGLAAGIGWIEEQGPENLRRRIVGLLEPIVAWAEGQPGWTVAGRWEPSTHAGVLSLIPGGRPPREIVEALDRRFGIAARAGLHDAPAIHHAMGTFPDGTLRISPGPFSTEADIAALLDALSRIVA